VPDRAARAALCGEARDTSPPQYGQIDLIGLTLFRIIEELVAVRKLLEDSAQPRTSRETSSSSTSERTLIVQRVPSQRCSETRMEG